MCRVEVGTLVASIGPRLGLVAVHRRRNGALALLPYPGCHVARWHLSLTSLRPTAWPCGLLASGLLCPSRLVYFRQTILCFGRADITDANPSDRQLWLLLSRLNTRQQDT